MKGPARSTRPCPAALAAVSLLAVVCGAAQAQPGGGAAPTQARHALLVGCTEYPAHPGVRELSGPANDVRMWARTLTDAAGFGFPAANVKQLVGWPEDADKRPTRANIVKALEDLIGKAAPGTQIFILLSGHGMQVPIPDSQKGPLDPKNPEPDGLDEVFLPADSRAGDDGVENVISDNQIGDWLDRMRDRGASVWIVFDSCHSGTMTRGAGFDPQTVEISRVVDPAAFGIKREHIDRAVRRAREAVEQAEAAGKRPRETASQKVKALLDRGGKGSLVAFYAAQPFEEAPELPLPEGAAHTRENYYGLLSYSVLQALQQRRSPISYRDLARLVAARYRATRGARPPTPFAEGDLDVGVLGLTVWPRPTDLALQHVKGKLRVDAGELLGLTRGSVLAVHPPPGDARDRKLVLGYVRVEVVSPTTAVVTPCELEAEPGQKRRAVAADDLPELGRCEIVSRDFGDMRVKLFADGFAPLQGALARMDPEAKAMVAVAAREADAEWVLRRVTPAQAEGELGIRGLRGDHVFLQQGRGRKTVPEEERALAERLRQAGQPVPGRVFARYPAADVKTLAGELERDLPKVFKWQNIWRVADGVSAQEGGETHGLRLELAKLKDENDRSGGELLRDGVLRGGQEMELRLSNEGAHDLWVTVLYLEANLGIEHYWSGVIRRGKPLKPFHFAMAVEGSSAGLEGMVAFAVPVSDEQKDPPRFDYLEQDSLQPAEVKKGNGSPTRAGSTTAFDRLLSAAAFNRGTRAIRPHVSTTPAVLSQSWILVP